MSPSPREFLQHILDEAGYLRRRSASLSRDEFVADETLQRAFVRSLEVIGEAAKNVSEEVRRRAPEIDWRGMAGLRDRLIHGYFGVNYEIVWEVATRRVPELEAGLLRLMESIEERE
jgi:uncharacterized protein with HEPN domain